MPTLEERIEKYTDDFFKELKKGAPSSESSDTPLPPRPQDIYQTYSDMALEYSRKRFPNGARPEYKLKAEEVLNGLQGPYAVAKNRVDGLAARGDSGRAEIARRQYMEDYYMPAVDALVLFGSADELLAMRQVLNELDDMTLPDGGVSGRGYTEALVRSMYDSELGQNGSKSDDVVRRCVCELRMLTDSGNIRAAVGKATKMLEKIESGENSADDYDYSLIQRIAAR